MAFIPVPLGSDGDPIAGAPSIVTIGGKYRSSVLTYSDGDAAVDEMDVNGNKKVTLATLIAGEDLTNNVMRTSVQGGNITAFQGTSPWVVNFQNSSILAVPQGSVITTVQANSVAGTYSDDSAHTNGVRGLLTLGVRNDTMASITSADNDYTHMTTGPSGETITAPAPWNRWWQAQTSVMYGTSVQAQAAGGSSVFTYITAMQVTNMAANISLVRITGGLGSVLAWTVAPASGGSNIIFNPALKTGENSGVSASISGVSSVYVSMQGFTARA